MATARSRCWCAATHRALPSPLAPHVTHALTPQPQEQRVEEPEQRTPVCMGSVAQVAACAEAMRGGKPPAA